MSGTQKALKVISIIVIVLSAITIALGILLFATGVSWRSSVSNPYDAVGGWGMIFGGLAIVFGAFLLIGGIFYLLFGILGLRGANNPSKIGPFFVISIIGLILAIIGVLGSVGLLFASSLGASSIVPYGFPLVFMIVCVYLANDIRKIRDGRKESEGARDGAPCSWRRP